MTKENATKIRGLFQVVIQSEHSSRSNIIGMKYMRIQVEVDLSKPLLTGFYRKIRSRDTWIHFAYERLAEFCYTCGRVGHGKVLCPFSQAPNQSSDKSQYGPWLRAKAEDFIVDKDGNFLRRIKFPSEDSADMNFGNVNRATRLKEDPGIDARDESDLGNLAVDESTQANPAKGKSLEGL